MSPDFEHDYLIDVRSHPETGVVILGEDMPHELMPWDTPPRHLGDATRGDLTAALVGQLLVPTPDEPGQHRAG